MYEGGFSLDLKDSLIWAAYGFEHMWKPWVRTVDLHLEPTLDGLLMDECWMKAMAFTMRNGLDNTL
jgi:hypothetical protein